MNNSGPFSGFATWSHRHLHPDRRSVWHPQRRLCSHRECLPISPWGGPRNHHLWICPLWTLHIKNLQHGTFHVRAAFAQRHILEVHCPVTSCRCFVLCKGRIGMLWNGWATFCSPSLCRHTLGWFPPSRYCRRRCCEHPGAGISGGLCPELLGSAQQGRCQVLP